MMRTGWIVLLLVVITALPGCWIFFIDQPSSVGEDKAVNIEVVLHADLGTSDVNTSVYTSVWCGAFPQSWDITDVSGTFRMSYADAATPMTLVEMPAQSAAMNADRPVSTAGLLSSWNCYAGISTVYNNDMIWNIIIEAEAGEAGIYTLYYAAYATSVTPAIDMVQKRTVVGESDRKWDAWETVNFLEEAGVQDNTPIPSAFLFGAAYGEGVYVLSMAASSSSVVGLLTVDQANSWVATAMQGHDQIFLNINYSGGKFLSASADGLLWISNDGIQWTSVDPGITVRGAAYGDNLHVAVGRDGGVAWSEDGLAWETTVVGSREWRDVIYDEGRFVAVGGDTDNAEAMASTDGRYWAVAVMAGDGPGEGSLADLAFGNGRYYATMQTNTIFSSDDGATWDTMVFNEEMMLMGIAHGGGVTMAVGLMKDINVVAYSSTDGVTWQRSNPGSSEIPTAITYGGDRRFYVSGTSFLLMRTVDRTSGGSGGGGCNTAPASTNHLLPELLLIAAVFGILIGLRRKGQGVKYKERRAP